MQIKASCQVHEMLSKSQAYRLQTDSSHSFYRTDED